MTEGTLVVLDQSISKNCFDPHIVSGHTSANVNEYVKLLTQKYLSIRSRSSQLRRCDGLDTVH